MGSDTFSLPVLEALLQRGPSLEVPVLVSGVVTQPDRPAGRGRRLVPNPVSRLAREVGIPVQQPERLRAPEAIEEVLGLAPDVIVVASFGQILPRALLDRPPFHALNLHPSLLPRYRGPSPVISPILEGDTVTGTTLMLMAPKMDAGAILDRIETPIGERETGGELRSRLAALSADLLMRDLPRWFRNEITPALQDDAAATYTRMIERADAQLDWTLPAKDLARRVRAFNPRPGAYTNWCTGPLRILSAVARPGTAPLGTAARTEGGEIAVGTGAGLLVVETLQLPGGRPMAARDAVRGHPELLGAQFGADG